MFEPKDPDRRLSWTPIGTHQRICLSVTIRDLTGPPPKSGEPADPGRAGGRCSVSRIRNAGRSDIGASRRTRLAGLDPGFAVLVCHPSSAPPSRRNLIFDPTASRRIGRNSGGELRGTQFERGWAPNTLRVRLAPLASVVGQLATSPTLMTWSRNTQRSREYFPKTLCRIRPRVPLDAILRASEGSDGVPGIRQAVNNRAPYPFSRRPPFSPPPPCIRTAFRKRSDSPGQSRPPWLPYAPWARSEGAIRHRLSKTEKQGP